MEMWAKAPSAPHAQEDGADDAEASLAAAAPSTPFHQLACRIYPVSASAPTSSPDYQWSLSVERDGSLVFCAGSRVSGVPEGTEALPPALPKGALQTGAGLIRPGHWAHIALVGCFEDDGDGGGGVGVKRKVTADGFPEQAQVEIIVDGKSAAANVVDFAAVMAPAQSVSSSSSPAGRSGKIQSSANSITAIGPGLQGGWRLTELRIWAQRRDPAAVADWKDNSLELAAVKKGRIVIRDVSAQSGGGSAKGFVALASGDPRKGANAASSSTFLSTPGVLGGAPSAGGGGDPRKAARTVAGRSGSDPRKKGPDPRRAALGQPPATEDPRKARIGKHPPSEGLRKEHVGKAPKEHSEASAAPSDLASSGAGDWAAFSSPAVAAHAVTASSICQADDSSSKPVGPSDGGWPSPVLSVGPTKGCR